MQLEGIKCHFPCTQLLCRGPVVPHAAPVFFWGAVRLLQAFPHYTTESLLVILILTHLFTHLYVHISGPQAAEFLKKGTPHSSQSDRHPPWKSQSPWQWECEETDKTELDFSEVRARSRHLLSRHPHTLHSEIQQNLGGRNKTCQNQRVPGRVRLKVEI